MYIVNTRVSVEHEDFTKVTTKVVIGNYMDESIKNDTATGKLHNAKLNAI